MTLDKLKTGECGRIISVRGEGELRHHLLDMGLTPGTEVSLRKQLLWEIRYSLCCADMS